MSGSEGEEVRRLVVASLDVGIAGCECDRCMGAGGCKDARFEVLRSRFSAWKRAWSMFSGRGASGYDAVEERWNCVDGVYGLGREYFEVPDWDEGRRSLEDEPVKLVLLFIGELPPSNDGREWFATCRAVPAAKSNSVIFERDNEGCEEGN